MRFLAWHLDYFRCRITERGRSSVVEEYDNPETTAQDALLVLASVEKGDEARPDRVARRCSPGCWRPPQRPAHPRSGDAS